MTELCLLANREMATGIFCGHILYTSWQLSNVLVHHKYGEIKRKQKYRVTSSEFFFMQNMILFVNILVEISYLFILIEEI